MKLKNIAAVVSFLIVAVSCSMEDDVLNEITKSETPNNSNQTEVSLSFDVNLNSVTTRANLIEDGTGGSIETVTDCSVILFENDKVIGVYDESLVVNGKLAGARFLVKTGRNYEVYVIGDTEQSFAECKTKADVLAIPFDGGDLGRKVKFGKAPVYISSGTSSALDSNITETIAVELTNLTAQIRLMDVVGDVNDDAEVSEGGAVELIKVELLDKNEDYNLAGTVNPANFVDETAVSSLLPFTITNRKWEDNNIAEFVTFPNVEGSAQIRLTFRVGTDETQTRTYTINRPAGTEDGRVLTNENKKNDNNYVNAGCIYQLYAKVSLVGDQVECTLTCYTQDWLYNEFVAELEESSEVVPVQ